MQHICAQGVGKSRSEKVNMAVCMYSLFVYLMHGYKYLLFRGQCSILTPTFIQWQERGGSSQWSL